MVSKSESDPINSTINPRGNSRIYVPTERAQSNPNISGFINESPYTGPGTCLQLQREEFEMRTGKILNLFHRLQRDIVLNKRRLIKERGCEYFDYIYIFTFRILEIVN